MPGVSGVTVVTNARVYYHTTRGCGRTKRPAFPAPSLGRKFLHNPGASRRGKVEVRLDVIALYTGKNRRSTGMKKMPRLMAKPMLHRIERSVGRSPR